MNNLKFELTGDTGPDLLGEENFRRKQEMQAFARSYRIGDPFPYLHYSKEETSTWKTVYQALKRLHATHASEEYIEVFDLCEKEGVLSDNAVAQFSSVSEFLKKRTGFTLHPIGGMLSARQFLAALALRVFCATQYIRPANLLFDGPEPDICHDIIGHIPLLANPEFANLTQIIGQASVGASDERVTELASLYWFTAEFGICKNRMGQFRAFGAGLLGCVDELQFCLSEEAVLRPLKFSDMKDITYPVTGRKPVYLFVDSFSKVIDDVKMHCHL